MMHIQLAHLIWGEYLKPGMTVVDATAGNGHDTLFLAKKVLREGAGWVHAFDVQEKALKSTRSLLEKNSIPLDRITLYHASHESFPKNLGEIDFIAYNLGYLPGGDKKITTLTRSTLTSCKNALQLLSPNGLMSIMLYPGHAEGGDEKGALLQWLESLPKAQFIIFHHSPLGSPSSPSLITLQKRGQFDPNYSIIVA